MLKNNYYSAGWLARYHSQVKVQIREVEERRAGQCEWNNSMAVGGWARPSNLLKV